MSFVYIGLGSNLGNREENLKFALDKIQTTFNIISKSFIYETKPFNVNEPQPNYLNQVIKVCSNGYNPISLLDKLLLYEEELGRVRLKKNESRIIDLDLLLYGDEIVNSKNLIVPHPRIHERPFVVFPLLDIDKELFHPTKQISFLEISLRLGSAGIKKL